MYDWRKMTREAQAARLIDRMVGSRPWHSPLHRFLPGQRRYIVTAACYEHAPYIGHCDERMDELADLLYGIATRHSERVFAWVVLPNHYHAVLQTPDAEALLRELGLMHGRTSHKWNGEEGLRGRKVWSGDVEREMRSERHLWASINYVHHNPVKHGYVKRWQEWPWSSARSFLEDVGMERATEIWREYPVLEYGKDWDD
jgi:putative transposase